MPSNKRGYIIVSLILLVVTIIVINSSLSKSNGEMTQSAAESTCQKEATIKMRGSEVSVVSLMNYNPQFYRTGDTASDGTPIYMLFWNGKMENGENSAQFVCNVSGTKNNVHIESLKYGATRLD